jgi:formylmethanofuran dehydrogenase subunit E-like metal-binding protein
VTSGYFIAQYIRKHYPIAPKEKYIWFACPPWCKDDAISTLLDLTPGKRSLFVKGIAEGRAAQSADGSFAGIIVCWNAVQKKGKAAVLQFDWKEAHGLAGIKAEDFRPKGGTSNPAFFTARIVSSWALIPYLDQPERFVKAFKEAEINGKSLDRMKQAGNDPYEIVGVAK